MPSSSVFFTWWQQPCQSRFVTEAYPVLVNSHKQFKENSSPTLLDQIVHFSQAKCSETLHLRGGSKDYMIAHIPNMVSPVCHSFRHFQLTLLLQLMFHCGQPLVSEARKSYTRFLLICWQVCQLASSAVAHYQKQLYLGLIFLAPTSCY